jgi:hypothetical protein
VLRQQLLDPRAKVLGAVLAGAFSQPTHVHHGNHEQVHYEQHADDNVGDHPEPRLLPGGDR